MNFTSIKINYFIFFSAEDRADEIGLYDTLKRSGLIEQIKSKINEKELENLFEMMLEVGRELKNYKGSLLSFLSDVINNLPEKAQKALEKLKDMDPELLKTLASGVFNFLPPIENNGLKEN